MFQQTDSGQTRTGEFHTRENRLQNVPEIQWVKEAKKRPGENLMRNLAVAASLVICAVVLRQGATPGWEQPVDAVMTLVTSDSLLDDSLGKLSFVSSLFPEATLVFGEQSDALSMPVSGGVIAHAWSENEPFTSWRSDSDVVRASAGGEVIGVYHGNGEERLIQVLSKDGISCLYGNLSEVSVQTGDAVSAGDVLGTVMTGADCVLEIRKNGISIDPNLLLP